MDSTESAGFSGPPVCACSPRSWRYVSGMCASAVGLCAAGWLALVPFAFGYWDQPHHGPHDAALTHLATAGALGAVSLGTLACWAAAWRRRLRADGAVPATSRRQARRQARALRQQAHGAAADGIPDPARVLDDLRTLLAALTADPAADPAAGPGQAGDTAAAGDTAPPAGTAEAAGTSGPSGTPGVWPDIPGPRSAPEDGRVPRDCQPVPAGPGGGEPAVAPVTPLATAEATAAPATPEATVASATPEATPEADPPGAGKRDGLAALESMLAGAELLMVGCGEEEEAW
jgi:hypothetical protein